MHRSTARSVARFAGAVAMIAALASCEKGTTTSPISMLANPVASVTAPPVTAGIVAICKDGPAGTYNFTATAVGGRVGTLLQGSSFTVDAGTCVNVWQALPNPPASDPVVTVTITEVNLPAGTQLDSIRYNAPEATLITGSSIAFQVNYYHGAVGTFFNSLVPPPPPAVCAGLTPGYWKNWAHHYTSAQFLQLLQGTISEGDVAQATTWLGENTPSYPRLRKFVLANQLTLNLTGTSLPNPSGGDLSATCALSDGTGLASTLASALDMLANPGNYTSDQMDAISDILNAFANLMGG
jgi:hypothetical protein